MDKKFIDKLAWIYIQDRKILSTRSHRKDVYYIPGGKREQGETDQQALRREIQEELDVELRPDTIKYIGTFMAQAHGHPAGVMVRMTCYSGEFIGTVQPCNEIAEIFWLTHKDKDRSSPVDKIIFDLLKEKNLID